MHIHFVPEQRGPDTVPAILFSPDDRADVAGGLPKILIVEDDYLVSVELDFRLREAGFDVVGVAVTAEEAVRLARSRKPALAIMDIRIAGPRDGIDTAIELLSDLGIRSIFRYSAQ
jgi:two-component system, response regulator PdtaR